MDCVGIVESCYQLDGDASQWLVRLVDAARPVLDLGCGVAAVLQDATHAVPQPPELLAFHAVGMSDETLGTFAPLSEAASSEVVSGRFRLGGPVGTFKKTLGSAGAEFKRVIQAAGIVDTLYVITGDTSAVHCTLAMPSREPVRMSRQRRLMMGRLAAHIATGFRLARSNSPELTEAILNPNGSIEHAVGGAASNDARGALREAAKAVDRARGSMRRSNPDEAVARWRALIAGRWSLLDHFDSDGRRYLIARPNEPAGVGFSALTQRERQVLGLAAHGHPYKIIAYELGLSVSTAATHLGRAMAKLGIDSRRQLLMLMATAPPHLMSDEQLAPPRSSGGAV
jgi:DNA-binding NarL/FixJ family response regulator